MKTWLGNNVTESPKMVCIAKLYKEVMNPDPPISEIRTLQLFIAKISAECFKVSFGGSCLSAWVASRWGTFIFNFLICVGKSSTWGCFAESIVFSTGNGQIYETKKLLWRETSLDCGGTGSLATGQLNQNEMLGVAEWLTTSDETKKNKARVGSPELRSSPFFVYRCWCPKDTNSVILYCIRSHYAFSKSLFFFK